MIERGRWCSFAQRSGAPGRAGEQLVYGANGESILIGGVAEIREMAKTPIAAIELHPAYGVPDW